jgi:hypothetical protein
MQPRLTVVVTTTQPWPECEIALDSVFEQATSLGGEVILADGGGDGPPSGRYPGLRRIDLPGANVFRLRSVGLAAAQGPVVALTEDHCRVDPDWCAAVLRAHDEHPEAEVIAGSVRNGADRRLIDWANFLVSNAGALPPVTVRLGPDVTGQANVSYKRRALGSYPPDALDEGLFRRDIAAAEGDEALRVDDRIGVVHVQSLSVADTLLIHFHDGRCVAAARQRRSPSVRAVLWAFALPLRVPAASVRLLARTLWRRPGYRRVTLLAAPWLVAVTAAHKLGELVGSVAGAGNSPDRMR